MLLTKKLLYIIIAITIIVITPCNGQDKDLEKEKAIVNSLINQKLGLKAITLIDSILNKKSSKQKELLFKSFKVKALVQMQIYGSALTLSNEILKNPKLNHAVMIRTRIERALLLEISGESKKSKVDLDFVRDYYEKSKVKKDEFYGEYLYRLSSWFYVQNLFDKALELAKKARDFGRQKKFKNVEATALALIGMIKYKSQPEIGVNYFKKGLQLWKKINSQEDLGFMYENISHYHLSKKHFKKAHSYIDSSIVVAKKLNHQFLLTRVYTLKSNIYENQGDIKNALFLYKKAKQASDSAIFKKETLKVSEANIKFNYEKENLKNKILEQNLTIEKKEKNYLLIGYSIFFILLCGLVYLIIRNYKKRKEIKTQSLIISHKNVALTDALDQNKLLLKELNHRVNNNLALILSLVKFQYYEIDEPKYKDKFQSLENRIKTIAAAHEQLLYNKENIDGENYDVQEYLLKITNALLDISTKNITLNLNAKSINLNIDTLLPIGILINELMSNSVKHAISKNDLIIDINITLHQNNINLTYKDSGSEFKEATNKKSLGVNIINSMIKQLKGTINRMGSEYKISLQLKNSKKV